MLAFICILLPSLLCLVIRNKIFPADRNTKNLLIEYALILLGMTYVLLVALVWTGHSPENLFFRLNNNIGLDQKYLLMSLVLAISEPFAERYLRSKRIEFSIVLPQKNINQNSSIDKILYVALIIFAIVLVGLNFIRIFDNNFWCDEAFDINMARQASQMPNGLLWTIRLGDLMPPFYRTFFYLFCKTFGFQGYIYHLFSLIAYLLVMLFALTVIYKNFGKCTSAIFMSLASLLDRAVYFNVEVRVYSWASLFMLLSFYEVYKILSTEKNLHFVLFTVFSLLAAYTHYYCILGLAAFYIVLLTYGIVVKNSIVKKILIVYVSTIVCYSPWVLILFKSFNSVSGGFWITTIPTMKDCIKYIFQGKHYIVLLLILAFGIIVSFIKESEVVVIKKSENKKWRFLLNFRNAKITIFEIWVVTGILGILATIIGGIGASIIFSPMFVLRYMYHVCIIGWLLFSVSFYKCKFKNFYNVITLFVVLAICFPQYKVIYAREKEMNERLGKTLADTVDKISSNDLILTDHTHINWAISKVYYPDVPSKYVDSGKMHSNILFDKYDVNWIIATKQLDAGNINNIKKNNNANVETIIERGNLGTHNVWIYKISRVMDARIDIKNKSESDNNSINSNINITKNSTDAKIETYNEDDSNVISYVAQSSSGKMDLEFTCVNSGALIIDLRGKDVRDESGTRIPAWIDYTKFVVNGEVIFDTVNSTWHDKPYKYSRDVKDGDVIHIYAEWQPHSS